LARGAAYLADELHPVRDDVRAELPALVAAARALVARVGELIARQDGG
jgi:hypothetical protein